MLRLTFQAIRFWTTGKADPRTLVLMEEMKRVVIHVNRCIRADYYHNVCRAGVLGWPYEEFIRIRIYLPLIPGTKDDREFYRLAGFCGICPDPLVHAFSLDPDLTIGYLRALAVRKINASRIDFSWKQT